MNKWIRFFPDFEEFSRNAALFICGRIKEITEAKGVASLVLSGGNSPGATYGLLSEAELPWRNIHFFFADERCVEPDSRRSNFHLAYKTLFSKTDIPQKNIHIMRGNLKEPETAALAYEAEINAFFEQTGDIGFDMMILGVGTDGHTASLFPGARQLKEKKRAVVPASAPRGIHPQRRITLTLPLINRSHEVVFLVSGDGKQALVEAVYWQQPGAFQKYPSARVKARKGVYWFVCEKRPENVDR